MKYTLLAGNSVIPFSIDGRGEVTIHPRQRTKRDCTYSDTDKLPERAALVRQLGGLASMGPRFCVFWLPLNNEKYAGIIVSKNRLIMENE